MIVSSGGGDIWGLLARPAPGSAAARLASGAARPAGPTPVPPVDTSPRVRPTTREEAPVPVARRPGAAEATATEEIDRAGTRARRAPPVGVPLADRGTAAGTAEVADAEAAGEVAGRAGPVRGERPFAGAGLPAIARNLPQPAQFTAASEAYLATWERGFQPRSLVDFSI